MLRLRAGVEYIDAGGSPLLFDTRRGGYFALNPSAATVIGALNDTGDLDTAAECRPAFLRFAPAQLARGAPAATCEQADRARRVVTTLSPHCGSGHGCLPRSIATAVLCRLNGTWPTWRSGVRYPPLASHAWIEAAGDPVGEDPAAIATFTPTLSVPPGANPP